MPDLKQLLEPLERREMPDRWKEIKERMPSRLSPPPRSRVGSYAVTALVAFITIGVVVRLAPLGEGNAPPLGHATQPPDWLAPIAYRFAYENGDMLPDQAAWTTGDVGSPDVAVVQGSDASVPLYTIVLYGNFTAFAEKGATGEPSTGTVMFARGDAETHHVVAWGITDDRVDISGMQPLTLPDPSHVVSSPDGWRIAVPPSWEFQQAAITLSDEQAQQTILSTVAPTSLTFAYEPMPVVAEPGFPPDGVALVVTATPASSMSFAPHSTPLSLSDFERSTGVDGSTVGILILEGPDEARYAVTVRIGPDASAIDRAALEEAVGSLAFA